MKALQRILFIVVCLLSITSYARSQQSADMSSKEFVQLSWEASSRRDFNQVNDLVKQCLLLYKTQADQQQAQLSSLPDRTEVDRYQALNDVATCLFIQAEALMNFGKTDEAIVQFKYIIEHYPWAQAWDPRGWYWSVAEKSHSSINVLLTGKTEDDAQQVVKKVKRTKPILFTEGTSKVVDYTQYGTFENVGTGEYIYKITDRKGLSDALGEGIYPNTGAVYRNPRYKELKKEGRLEGSHWDYVNSNDLEASYFKWVTAHESWGVRLFYIGLTFEKAKMYYEAIKAYHALIVQYPKTVAWTYWKTPWYPAQAAVAKIQHIIRTHPELGYQDELMKIQIQNGNDNEVDNDVFITYPGKIVKKGVLDKQDRLRLDKSQRLGKIKQEIGQGQVRLVQYENDHWQLLVNDKPYLIKGITYAPTKVGQSPDKGTLANWMEEDTNQNGLPDGPYDAWVDKNRNNIQDQDEPVVGDFQLLKEMGVNTMRLYHNTDTVNKKLLRTLFEDYGIRIIMGDFLGKYALGSGASWMEGTDYANPEHRNNMLNSVKEMVMAHKDEPYVLMWLLGNENNYGVASNADKKPEVFFQFVDEVAQWIKTVDQNHPVSVSNGDTLFLDVFAKHSPNVDIFTANVYRGDYGFGSFWDQVAETSGKPAFITEFGCPAYAGHLTQEGPEQAQAEYHRGNWMDIEENLAGVSRGAGNALGGVVFEWMDEWWKNYEPYLHDKKSDVVGPFPGGYYFEEWFGIVGQGNGENSPFLRQLRKSYDLYKELWNKEEQI